MKNIILLPVIILIGASGCIEQNNRQPTERKGINHTWLDSIIKNSDSSYTRPYKRTDFVTSLSYINKKDSVTCQLMKDSAGSIRQIIIARKNVRIFFARYYANGQLQADLQLDEFGQYHGTAVFHYENGQVESTGNYDHGIKTGQWKNFDTTGKLISTGLYNKNGQLIK